MFMILIPLFNFWCHLFGYLVSNSCFVLGFYLLTPRLTLTFTSCHSRAGSCPFGLVLLLLHALPAYARRSSCIHIIMRYVNTGLCLAILYRSPNTSILFELGFLRSGTFWSDFSLIGTIYISLDIHFSMEYIPYSRSKIAQILLVIFTQE